MPGLWSTDLDIDQLPWDEPLSSLIDVDPYKIRANRTPIEFLSISTRPSNCLQASNLLTLDKILNSTIRELIEIPSMGRGSVLEVIKKTAVYLQSNPNTPHITSVPKQQTPATLRDEWRIFSGQDDCGHDTSLSHLLHDPDLIGQFSAAKVEYLHDVLDWTLEETEDLLGQDQAEAFLHAMLVFAVEHRETKTRDLVTIVSTFEERAALLSQRWGDVTTERLGLSEHNTRILTKAGLFKLSDILAALQPLHNVLYLNLPLFCQVWERLVDLDLRQGNALAERARVIKESAIESPLAGIVEELQEICGDRPWQVLSARFRFNENDGAYTADGTRRSLRTLDEVGNIVDLSRERVRQLESIALKKLNMARRCHPQARLFSVEQTIVLLTHQAGGVLSVTQCGRLLMNQVDLANIASEDLCHLVFELSSAFSIVERGAICWLPNALLARHYHSACSSGMENVNPGDRRRQSHR